MTASRFRLRSAQRPTPCLSHQTLLAGFTGLWQPCPAHGGSSVHTEGRLPGWLAPCSSQGSKSTAHHVSPAPGSAGTGDALAWLAGESRGPGWGVHGLKGPLLPGEAWLQSESQGLDWRPFTLPAPSAKPPSCKARVQMLSRVK